ncbi:uncharacterized protein LOC129755656 [Uranotaenia lowii]|uniref:uncharacterized protein LOC129755656 n=1 Tax=Uranotaenia lowii TaxID=190385 RepID=UPI00247AE300|nr:uncharacterized protein LOC129755656 [Uranotaenia lowii]
MSEITYGPVLPEDFEVARQFIVDYFYAFEPMNRAYIHGKEPAEEDVEFSVKFLNEGLGVKATVDDGRIVGISLGYIGSEDDVAVLTESVKNSRDRKWGDILQFLIFVHESSNVSEKFGVSDAYEIQIVGVHPDFRGRSIAKELVRKQLQLAKEKGFKGVYVDCSNVFTAKIMESLEFEIVNEIVLENYRTEKGEQIFQPEDQVNRSIKSYFKRI